MSILLASAVPELRLVQDQILSSIEEKLVNIVNPSRLNLIWDRIWTCVRVGMRTIAKALVSFLVPGIRTIWRALLSALVSGTRTIREAQLPDIRAIRDALVLTLVSSMRITEEVLIFGIRTIRDALVSGMRTMGEALVSALVSGVRTTGEALLYGMRTVGEVIVSALLWLSWWTFKVFAVIWCVGLLIRIVRRERILPKPINALGGAFEWLFLLYTERRERLEAEERQKHVEKLERMRKAEAAQREKERQAQVKRQAREEAQRREEKKQAQIKRQLEEELRRRKEEARRKQQRKERENTFVTDFESWSQCSDNPIRLREPPQPPGSKGTVCTDMTCRKIKRDLDVSFCKHSVKELVEAYVKIKEPTTKHKDEIMQKYLRKQIILWHPDKNFRHCNERVKKQAEELTKLMGSLLPQKKSTWDT
ncbi:hypothetical protein GGR54DRAFT_625761 [Hypoxylon sp. NC1633]|nr:hypothetical protein GGR54DRAFT_625761 [Hypoxylon sp. NC1633]